MARGPAARAANAPLVAVDAGWAFTRVIGHVGPSGEVPSLVRWPEDPGAPDVGWEACGRGRPARRVTHPFDAGRITCTASARQLLRRMLPGTAPRGATLLATVPDDLTADDARAWLRLFRETAGVEALLLPDAPVAAYGAGLPIDAPTGMMTFGVGASRSTAAVIALGGAVVSRSRAVGGRHLDEAIQRFARQAFRLWVDAESAERLRRRHGVAGGTDEPVVLSGRELGTGLPRAVEIRASQLRDAMSVEIAALRQLVLDTLAATPPALSADLLDHGIVLIGGASRTPGLDAMLRDATRLVVLPHPTPQDAARDGLRRLLGEPGRCREWALPVTL